MPSVASQLLDVEINTDIIAGARWDEIHALVKSHQLIQQARDDFLAGLLEWWEYLELCESHQLNIDSYLDNVEDNLNQIGIIV